MRLSPVTGTKFKFQCSQCEQWKWSDNATHANLDGRAFASYYCGECIEQNNERLKPQ